MEQNACSRNACDWKYILFANTRLIVIIMQGPVKGLLNFWPSLCVLITCSMICIQQLFQHSRFTNCPLATHNHFAAFAHDSRWRSVLRRYTRIKYNKQEVKHNCTHLLYIVYSWIVT